MYVWSNPYKDFEVKAINTAKNPPKMWKRYVDDTCVILSSISKDDFFHHINSIAPESNLHLRIPNQIGQFHFWTLWLCHNQMDQSRQLSSENQPILICICIQTVTITCLQNIVSLTPLDTGQKLYVPPNSY